jgi:hypothetical protein
MGNLLSTKGVARVVWIRVPPIESRPSHPKDGDGAPTTKGLGGGHREAGAGGRRVDLRAGSERNNIALPVEGAAARVLRLG